MSENSTPFQNVPAPPPREAGPVPGLTLEILEPLFWDGWTWRYRALDARNDQRLLLLEMAPPRSTLLEFGRECPELDEIQYHTLRSLFIRSLQRPASLGAHRTRTPVSIWQEANHAMVGYADSHHTRSLEDLIATHGFLSEDQAAKLLPFALESLHELHRHGIYHGDIRLGTLHIGRKHQVVLDAPACGREWWRDTVQDADFGPDEPPEYQELGGYRGPWSDLYALASTLLRSMNLDPHSFAPGPHSSPFLRSLAQPLHEDPAERPANANEWRRACRRPRPSVVSAARRMQVLDEKLKLSQRVKPSVREAPGGATLLSAKPLASLSCGVCGQAKITERKVDADLCPECRTGTLRAQATEGPVCFCPACVKGKVKPVRRLMGRPTRWRCQECGWTAISDRQQAITDSRGRSYADWETLRKESGRSAVIRSCEVCQAQFDELTPTIWRRMASPNESAIVTLTTREWQLRAKNLDPMSGNATCPQCSADYHLEEKTITFLDSHVRLPHSHMVAMRGQRFSVEQFARRCVGLTRPDTTLLAESRELEFAEQDGKLKLLRSDRPALRPHVGRVLDLGDWHRLDRELPNKDEIPETIHRLQKAIVEAVTLGQMPMDFRHRRSAWRGRVNVTDSDDGKATSYRCVVENGTLHLQTLLRRRTYPLAEVLSMEAEGEDSVRLAVASGSLSLQILPTLLQVPLTSDTYEVQLDRDVFLARLERAWRKVSLNGAAGEPQEDSPTPATDSPSAEGAGQGSP